jgi:membrane protease YdiL (CAAX protease family)
MTTIKAFIKSHPVLTYFALAFAISSGGLLIAVALEGLPLDARNSWIAALALFAGPSVAGLLMTGLVHGRAGLRELLARIFKWRVGARWYAVALLTTPLLVIPILLALSLISPVFLPDAFTTDDVVVLLLLGLMVGSIGGFSEELGWTGFAVPTVRQLHGVLTTGLIVGAMWAAWHVPVTFLSTLSPSGAVSWSLLLPPLFFYMAVLPAYRVLMVWVYDRTESLLVAMLMHTSLAASTFVVLLPPATGVALMAYYLVLVAVLWVVIGAIALANHGHLTREPPLRRRVA